jgi:hypothetical protein
MFISENQVWRGDMNWEKLRGYLVFYVAIVIPALLMVVAVIASADVLWFFMLMVWIMAGLMIVILPSNPDTITQ